MLHCSKSNAAVLRPKAPIPRDFFAAMAEPESKTRRLLAEAAG